MALLRKFFHILKPVHFRKFFSVARQDGPAEALRRAAYFSRLIISDAARSDVRQYGRADEVPTRLGGFFPFWTEISKADAFHISTPSIKRIRKRRLAIIGDLNLPQCRKYRVEQVNDLWRCADAEVEYSHYEDFPRSARIMQNATHVMFYRLKTQDITCDYLYEARRLGLPVAYDIDDPLFSVAAYQNYGAAQTFDRSLMDHFLREAPRYAAFMDACDVVCVSTPTLAALARQHTPRPVFVRRNFADKHTLASGSRAIQDAIPHKSGSTPFTFSISTGSTGRSADFRDAFNALGDISREQPNLRIVIIGHFRMNDVPRRIRDRVKLVPFVDYDQYLTHLARSDCNLIPMADDLFNRCKSGVRVIDSCAAAVPAIVTQVGDGRNLVQNSQTGIVLNKDTGWKEAISIMVSDRDRTMKMGQAARRLIESRWSASMDEQIVDPQFKHWFLS
ncbi:glycosyl transferase family 1 [Albidovulum inexpectatum]|uniref:Glycosyl transferase family 1 n=1 Tax=Albidovulum inexpectatum TaxID=196587 RepID=A0A2S5JEV3_9RHOB|nr:glycosyltransferase [Albidovulum inexpectatum]PPB79941.1 glycosyl transferase family 1 [Albidovulum inexpectatum]